MPRSSSKNKANGAGRAKRPEAQANGSRRPVAKKTGRFSAEALLAFYRQMTRIRRFEEKAGQLYGMGLIGGYCHLYIGEEAVAVGVQSVMKDGDSFITGYRLHGHILVAGADEKRVMAELTGREDGCSHGKGGSMHMFAVDKGFYGGHGIVGAQVSLGTGIAFAHQYRGEQNICAIYLGDGAANQGQVAESLNMAALWKLPALYIIENNRYGMGTTVEHASAGPGLAQRGEAYGIPGQAVDGMDVMAVADAAADAAQWCRQGKGPFILEAQTYRYRGHSMSDPANYRKREEVQHVREEKDPIEGLKQYILKHRLADEEQLKSIDAESKATAADAAAFAQDSPEPPASSLFDHVWCEEKQEAAE